MINLLPPETKEAMIYGRRNIATAQYALLVALVAVSLAGVLLFGVRIVSADERNLREAIAGKEEELAALNPKLQEAKNLKRTMDTISALLDREIKFSQLLQDIASVIPNGAVLKGLSLTGDPTIPLQIDAEVRTEAMAAVLRENLERSDLFEQADIQSISAGERSSGAIVTYRVRLVVGFEKENGR